MPQPTLTPANKSASEMLKEVMHHYESTQQGGKYHGVIIGDKASGKTTALGTLPAPVFIMSFNPGGTTVLKQQIKDGLVVVDARYEDDNMEAPQAWLSFWKNFHDMKRSGFFNQFSSFALDGLTELGRCILWYLLYRGNRMYPSMDAVKATIDREKQGPRFHEWDVVLNTMVSLTREIVALPMHTCITGHIERDKDENLMAYVKFLMFPGQSKEQIPGLVPEVYYLLTEEIRGSDKPRRYFQTVNNGEYKAGTRMGAEGKLEAQEPPNLAAMIKKCGYDTSEKPLIKV